MRMGLGLHEYGGWCNPNAVRRVARRLKTAVCALLGCVLAMFALTGCGNVNGSDQADAWNEAADPWSYSFGVHVFTEGDGRVLRPVWRVIDVAEHQRNINWQKVKQSEVDAAILRIGYGHGNEDKYFKNNLAQVRVNRIPHGLYLYSYAYDTDFAREGGEFRAANAQEVFDHRQERPYFLRHGAPRRLGRAHDAHAADSVRTDCQGVLRRARGCGVHESGNLHLRAQHGDAPRQRLAARTRQLDRLVF